MSVRLWDFQCDDCGKAHNRVPYSGDHVPETIDCDCGGKASWAMGKTNGLNMTHSGLYDLGADPSLNGENPQSYGERKRILREQGKVEVGGPEKLDDIMDDGPEDRGARNPDVGIIGANTDEEMMDQLMDMTYGDPRVSKRDTGDPRRELMDSGLGWGV